MSNLIGEKREQSRSSREKRERELEVERRKQFAIQSLKEECMKGGGRMLESLKSKVQEFREGMKREGAGKRVELKLKGKLQLRVPRSKGVESLQTTQKALRLVSHLVCS